MGDGHQQGLGERELESACADRGWAKEHARKREIDKLRGRYGKERERVEMRWETTKKCVGRGRAS